MLVQLRENGLRLIRQHDHALLAGRLAAAWQLPPAGPVPWSTVLAVSLHDAMWISEDRGPRLDRSTGRPHDFASFPARLKRPMIADGVDRLRRVVPELGSAVADHHRALAEGPGPAPDPVLTRIRFFDVLSLVLCLTPPGSRQPPSWLVDPPPVAPDGFVLPRVVWRDPDTAALSPWPFPRLRDPQEWNVPFRDLPGGPWATGAELEAAWRQAPDARWPLRLAPGTP